MDEDPLVIRLERIGAEGLDLDEVVEADWLAEALGTGSPYRSRGPGRLTVHLQRLDGDDGAGTVVHVRGHAAFELEADCSRCLEPVCVNFNASVEVAMFPPDVDPPVGPDGELTAEDMGVATYGDHGVDLGALVHDEVFLQLPMNPLCAESCSGLCPQCGINLNEEKCRCERQEQSWSAFRDIKLN